SPGLSLYFEDGHDDLDDFGFDDYGSECDGIRITAFLDAGQDNLTPLGRLEKYAFSENVFNRWISGYFFSLKCNAQCFLRSSIRFYVHLYNICTHTCIQMPHSLIQRPVIQCFLNTNRSDNPLSRQAALLVLLEQGLMSKADMEGKVCPVLLELTEPSSDDDYKIEAVAIMCKLVTMLTKDTVEHLLLLRFCELCSDVRLFQVRKVCAANFGEFCSIVGQEATEKLLMPKFFDLCSDSLWGIRKACAECFMVVSNCTSPEVRRTKLSPLFINLICDQSRWVRQAAFQSLGRFISTFANPSITGLNFYLTGPPSHRPEGNSSTQPKEDGTSLGQPKHSAPFSRQQMDDCTVFNSFNFWRSPLPDITQDLQLLQEEERDEVIEKEDETMRDTEGEGKEDVPSLDAQGPATSSQIQKVLDCLQPHLDDPDVQAQVKVLSAALKAAQLESQREDADESVSESNGSTGSPTSDELSAMSELSLTDAQISDSPSSSPVLESDLIENNVIPQQLLDQYLSMTDPARAQTVDTEIAKHCAFSLPGVVLTLGRQNWHCLKDTYETLATDVQWKVRRTLAFSIHELAVILGDQLTAADLVPIFNCFLKDLDEVRIGVLKHLYDFLKLLHADKRREYLYQLQEFMVTDNSRNWRFRYELAEQLILIIELYSHNDVYDYLRQIALNLCSDKVSEVRWISYKLVVEILQKLYACEAHDLGLNFINELIMRFCHCSKWVGRQAFAFICQAIVEEDCMPMDQFAQHLLPSLLSLSSDPVPNVRVLVAKALRQSVLEKPYFKDPGSAYSDELEEALSELRMDKDRDVRFFSTLDPNRNVMDTSTLDNQNCQT
uniref:Serine/threonine-protein phosphatase 4 regulatory subunit 1-like n=1 Tax=Sinocyclocheilus anshuiensis TaxID=1608454 RepID=A0A671QRV4_9TELE